jgi:hypothetical protein
MKVVLHAIVYSKFAVMIITSRALRALDWLQIVNQLIFAPRGPNEVALIEILAVLAHLPPPSLLQDGADKRVVIPFPDVELSWCQMLLRINPVKRYTILLVDDLIESLKNSLFRLNLEVLALDRPWLEGEVSWQLYSEESLADKTHAVDI